MPPSVKICGLKTPETLEAAIRAGAHYVGLNFYAPSPRHVGFDTARALAARIPDRVKTVGVFVDPCNAVLEQAIDAGQLDVIQLHNCTPARAASIAQYSGVEVWAALPVKTSADLLAAGNFRGAASMLLYDAKVPDTAPLPGGMGLRFDWTLLSRFAHPLPWGLAGGLSIDNLAEAWRTTKAGLFDVSSGVESAPGAKDVDKIAAFLKAASQL